VLRAISGLLTAALTLSAFAAHAAEFSLWPQLEIGDGYSDNVDQTAANHKGDFLGAQSPGATLEASAPSRNFFLTYETLLLEHASYPSKDQFFRDNYFGLEDFEQLWRGAALSVNESLLTGNALGGGIITGGSTPVGQQLMQSLLFSSNTTSNNFSMNLSSRYSDSFSWLASTYQNTFTILSGDPLSKYNFAEGASLAGDWAVGERWTAGAICQLNDFRFSNGSVPRTDSQTLAMRLKWGDGTPLALLGQLGPTFSNSSAGTAGTNATPSQTSIEAAFLVAGTYTGRRLTMTGTFSQAPSENANLPGVTTAQSYAALVQYKLTRRTIVFANGGYYAANGDGTSARVITYMGGISYALSENLSLSASYLGYRTAARGSAASSIVSSPGNQAVTNFFMVGFTLHPLPLRWKW
jgi:opacity protein-like surface antigen